MKALVVIDVVCPSCQYVLGRDFDGSCVSSQPYYCGNSKCEQFNKRYRSSPVMVDLEPVRDSQE